MMKYIDKFLKKLNTNRNTFATFILTLLTVYLAVDRLVEMLIMIFTGVSVSYWGPITYTLALACPVFAYLFCGSSHFATSKSRKVTLFYLYMIGLYIIALSMFTQFINAGAWILLVSVPNYTEIATEFAELIRPAFCYLSLYLPLVTILPFMKWIVLILNDTTEIKRSLWDYKGIKLDDPKKNHGPYTCDMYLFNDWESGKSITFSEAKRFHSLLVCGGSGSGKTSLVFEPFIARDLEKKSFFSEISKELGHTALKTGLATLNCPYDNDYLNAHFTLDMLTPVSGKESLYKTYVKKMTLSSSPYVYRNIGLSYIAPDAETINKMVDVCKNFKLGCNIVDPSNSESIGLNPFVYNDVQKISLTISTVLKELYIHNYTEKAEAVQSFREDAAMQAIEHLIILLKETYPKLNQGALPTLEDMLKLLSNFDLVEKMCKILETDEKLAETYAVTIGYFKRHFYKDSVNREATENYVSYLVTQLDGLLRLPGVKSIICNRTNNINFDDMLSQSQITFVCTRRGDLGEKSHRVFGLFFLLSMQNAVLRRPGDESTRVPYFLYIDEFPEFICRATDAMFTMFRKYRVGNIIAIQSISQLETDNSRTNYKNTILSNCANKIFTGNATPDECKWWSIDFGQRRKWKMSRNMDMGKLEYDSKASGVKWDWEDYFAIGKLQTLDLKSCAYNIKNDSGKPTVGQGVLSFLSSKYKEEQKVKTYNFSRFTKSSLDDVHDDDTSGKKKKRKFNPKNVDFSDENHEIDPIQTDSEFLFDNEDAIIFDLKNNTNG